MRLDKPLFTSECLSSSMSRQAWTRGPLQSIVIYSVLESSTWDYLGPPLVAMLCLGALIFHDITLHKTPWRTIVWFFKIPHSKGQERTFQMHVKDGSWRTVGKSQLSAKRTFWTPSMQNGPKLGIDFAPEATSGNVWRHFCHNLSRGRGIFLSSSR